MGELHFSIDQARLPDIDRRTRCAINSDRSLLWV